MSLWGSHPSHLLSGLSDSHRTSYWRAQVACCAFAQVNAFLHVLQFLVGEIFLLSLSSTQNVRSLEVAARQRQQNRCTALLSKTDGKEMQCMPTHRTVFHIIMLCTWRLFPNFAHDNAVKICFDRKGRWILQGGLWVHSPLLEMWMCLREMCTCIAKGRGLSGWEWVKLYRCNGLRP